MRNLVSILFSAILLACSGGGDPQVSGDPKGGDKVNAPPLSGESGCEKDADCGEGQGCAMTSGLCTDLAEEGQTFSVLVKPKDSTGLLPDQYVSVPVGAGGRLDLTIDEPVEVSGVVVFGQGEARQDVDPASTPTASAKSEFVGGYLVARAPGLIPGTRLRSETVVASDTQGKEEIEDPGTDTAYKPTYRLNLLRGVTYEIAFIPDDRSEDDGLPDLPVHYVSAEFSKGGRFDLILPSKEQYLDAKFTGVVLMEADGSTPVKGAMVTGVVGSGAKGTTAASDENGVFTLVLPPGEGLVTVKVEPGEDSPMFPKREFQYTDGLNEITVIATPKFVVGPVPPEREVLFQVVHVASGNLEPVPQARVEAHGVAGGGEASSFGLTDEEGVVEMTLLEGLYSLTVMPPAGSKYASKQMALDLKEKKNEEVFVVPLANRARITGHVRGEESGEPVVGAVVTLQTNRVDAFEGAQQGFQEFGVDAVADGDGAFEVYLDPGPYAIMVEPPITSGLARFSQPSVDLTSGDAQMNVMLPKGVLVRGRLTMASTGEVVTEAQIQFYFDFPEKSGGAYWALDQTSFATVVQLAGVSSVDSQGDFSAVVPLTRALDAVAPGRIGFENGTGDTAVYGLPAVEVIPAPLP